MKRKNKIILLAVLIISVVTSAIVITAIYQSPRIEVVFDSAMEGQHLIFGINDVQYKFNITVLNLHTTNDFPFPNASKVAEELQPLQEKYGLCTQVYVNRSNFADHYFAPYQLKFQYAFVSDGKYAFYVWRNSTLPNNQIISLTSDIQSAFTMVLNSNIQQQHI